MRTTTTTVSRLETGTSYTYTRSGTMAGSTPTAEARVRAVSRQSRTADESYDICEVVESQDLLEYNPPLPYSTSAILNYCQRNMVQPYMKFLAFLGLKPIVADITNRGTVINFLNQLYFLFLVCLLLTGYILQFLTCYRRDLGFQYTSNLSSKQALMAGQFNASAGKTSSAKSTITCEGSVLLCYVVPSILHVFAFLYLAHVYRATENEHLQTLMEKAFLLTASSRGSIERRAMFRWLRCLVLVFVLWLLWSLATQLLIVLAIPSHFVSIVPPPSRALEKFFTGLLIAATFWQDVVHGSIVCNYCIECQLMSSYILSIKERVLENSMELETSMKEMLDFHKFVKFLNEYVAPSVGLLFLVSSVRTAAGVGVMTKAFFLSAGIDIPSIAVILLLVQWLTITIAPLLWAARLTSACRSLRTLGQLLRTRPFGFQDTPVEMLDSFSLFIASHHKVARLFLVTVSAAMIGAAAFGFAFVLLVRYHLV